MERLITFVLFLAAVCLLPAAARGQSQPHLQRSGPNLFPDPGISGVSAWSVSDPGIYDSTVSRQAGSGSVRLTATYPTGWAESPLMPVTPGKTYTLAAYLKTDAWPSIAALFFSVYGADGKFIENRGGSDQATTSANTWEEAVIIFQAVPGDAMVKATLNRDGVPRSDGSIWFDDFYFGEGTGFEQAPTPKQAFSGTSVHVDSLGNFTIRDGGTFEPFAPFCICVDGRRADWSVFTTAGFNCVTWATDASAVQHAKAEGMVSGLEISDYINLLTPSTYGDTSGLASLVHSVHDQGLDDSVLFYYFDNESYQYYDQSQPLKMWTVAQTVLDTIDATERAIAGGQRIRPRYSLQGNEGLARMYAGYVDIVGDYVGGNAGGAAGSPEGLFILDNIEGQPAPPALAQINPTQTAASMRQLIYRSFMAGAKGFSFWRDIDPNASSSELATYAQDGVVPVEQTAWFTVLPKIKAEIEQLLPILSQPHWTVWKALPQAASLAFATRDYQSEGYLFLVNMSAAAVTSSIAIQGLPYAPASAVDFFNAAAVVPVSNASFTVTLPASATAVYRLVRPGGVPDGGGAADKAVGADAGVTMDGPGDGPAAAKDLAATESGPPGDAGWLPNRDLGAGAGKAALSGGCGCHLAGGREHGTAVIPLALIVVAAVVGWRMRTRAGAPGRRQRPQRRHR